MKPRGKMASVGLEPPSEVPGKQGVDVGRGAESGAPGGGSASNRQAVVAADPDLAAVAAAWPDLPAALKAGIAAMIRAARG